MANASARSSLENATIAQKGIDPHATRIGSLDDHERGLRRTPFAWTWASSIAISGFVDRA